MKVMKDSLYANLLIITILCSTLVICVRTFYNFLLFFNSIRSCIGNRDISTVQLGILFYFYIKHNGSGGFAV